MFDADGSRTISITEMKVRGGGSLKSCIKKLWQLRWCGGNIDVKTHRKNHQFAAVAVYMCAEGWLTSNRHRKQPLFVVLVQPLPHLVPQ